MRSGSAGQARVVRRDQALRHGPLPLALRSATRHRVAQAVVSNVPMPTAGLMPVLARPASVLPVQRIRSMPRRPCAPRAVGRLDHDLRVRGLHRQHDGVVVVLRAMRTNSSADSTMPAGVSRSGS